MSWIVPDIKWLEHGVKTSGPAEEDVSLPPGVRIVKEEGDVRRPVVEPRVVVYDDETYFPPVDDYYGKD